MTELGRRCVLPAATGQALRAVAKWQQAESMTELPRCIILAANGAPRARFETGSREEQ